MTAQEAQALGYEMVRPTPRGLAGLQRYLYTVAIVVGIDEAGYVGRYCFPSFMSALVAFDEWSGDGDPPGPWIKYKGRGGERYGPGITEPQGEKDHANSD